MNNGKRKKIVLKVGGVTYKKEFDTTKPNTRKRKRIRKAQREQALKG